MSKLLSSSCTQKAHNNATFQSRNNAWHLLFVRTWTCGLAPADYMSVLTFFSLQALSQLYHSRFLSLRILASRQQAGNKQARTRHTLKVRRHPVVASIRRGFTLLYFLFIGKELGDKSSYLPKALLNLYWLLVLWPNQHNYHNLFCYYSSLTRQGSCWFLVPCRLLGLLHHQSRSKKDSVSVILHFSKNQ